MGILEMKTAVNGLEWNIEYADDKVLDNEGDGVVLGVTKFLEQKIYIRRGMSIMSLFFIFSRLLIRDI